jgi:hypothetical protein
MNMRKLGTVAQSNSGQAKSANPRKYKAGGLMRYTLCVIKEVQRRNSYRNSFNPVALYQHVFVHLAPALPGRLNIGGIE